MKLLRLHWFDVGMILAVLVAGRLPVSGVRGVKLILWINLVSLSCINLRNIVIRDIFRDAQYDILFHQEAGPISAEYKLPVGYQCWARLDDLLSFSGHCG